MFGGKSGSETGVICLKVANKLGFDDGIFRDPVSHEGGKQNREWLA